MSVYVKPTAGLTESEVVAKSFNPLNTEWKIYNQEFIHVSGNRFIGELALFGAATAGSSIVSITTVDTNRFGVGRYTSGGTIGNYVAAYPHNLTLLFGGADHRVTSNMRHTTTPDATNDYQFWHGFSNDTNSIGASMSCIGIDRSINATNYIAFSIQGSRTNVDTGIAIDTNWHVFDVIANADNTSHTYYIDGVLVATITTNLPTGALAPMVFQINVAGAARIFEIDTMTYGFKPTTARGTSAEWL